MSHHGAGDIVYLVRIAERSALGPTAPVDADIFSARALTWRVIQGPVLLRMAKVISLVSQDGRSKPLVIMDAFERLQWLLVLGLAHPIGLAALEPARTETTRDCSLLCLQTFDLHL